MPDRLRNATQLLWITVASLFLAGVLKYAQWFIAGTPLAEIIQGMFGVLVLQAAIVGGVGNVILLSDLVAAWVRPVNASARRILVSMGATMVGLSVAVALGRRSAARALTTSTSPSSSPTWSERSFPWLAPTWWRLACSPGSR